MVVKTETTLVEVQERAFVGSACSVVELGSQAAASGLAVLRMGLVVDCKVNIG